MKGISDLRFFIEEEISKKRAVILAQNTTEPEVLAAALWEFVLLNENPISWRATWFLEHLGAENKAFVRPYLDAIVEQFPKFKYDGQRRSSLKILLMFPITNFDYAKMLNYCFDLILSNEAPVAVRMFSMTMLLEIVKREPELKSELKESLEFIIPHAQKGLLSAARKTLRALEKV